MTFLVLFNFRGSVCNYTSLPNYWTTHSACFISTRKQWLLLLKHHLHYPLLYAYTRKKRHLGTKGKAVIHQQTIAAEKIWFVEGNILSHNRKLVALELVAMKWDWESRMHCDKKGLMYKECDYPEKWAKGNHGGRDLDLSEDESSICEITLILSKYIYPIIPNSILQFLTVLVLLRIAVLKS